MEPHQADPPGNGKTAFWKKGFEALRRWGGGSLKLLVLALLLFAYLLAEETEAKLDDSVFLGALAIFSLWTAYGYLTRLLRYFFRKNAFRPEEAQSFLLLWRYVWLGGGVILAIISFSGSIGALGISAAFLGMVLGWSLQAPVTGIAAWIMIMTKRPFGIGDRIIVSGITGDVMDINMTHIVLNQVGGTVSGEERSGRGVLIPNATLFSQVIHNYTYESKFVLDEVAVLITHRSDFEEAKRILLDAAERVTADIIRETGEKPYIRVEISPEHGIRMRLRFRTLATDRQRISSEITEIVIQEFADRYDRVEFSYPHTRILYRGPHPEAGGGEAPGPVPPGA